MIPIIGQEKLKNQLDSYTLKTLPKTILFIGEEGCGKALFANYLAEKFDLEQVYITNDITHEQLVDYAQDARLRLYVIELSNFVEKQQNQFLKFIEEPGANMFVVLTADSERGVLSTILNRCIKFYFEPYTLEQLQQFEWMTDFFKVAKDDDLIYSIYNTPGQLYELQPKLENVLEAFKFCKYLISKIKTASYANTISIINKIKCKDDIKTAQDLEKFELTSFLKILEQVAFNDYKENKNDLSLKIYLYTNKSRQNIFSKTINREAFMLDFLDGLWRETR